MAQASQLGVRGMPTDPPPSMRALTRSAMPALAAVCSEYSLSTSSTAAFPCRRVLGVGDSFGELAFVQGRPHPTSAIARSDSMLITLRRSNMSPQSVSRMLSLIEKPYGMDSVFDKDISDRNEKDILLLVNYLEINPFLKQLAYPALIACARTALRHKLMAGEPLCTDLVSDKISETSVYIVNAGSVQVTPDIRGAAVAEQLQNLSSPSQTFLE